MMLGVVRSAKRCLVSFGVQKNKKYGLHNAVHGKGDLFQKNKKYEMHDAMQGELLKKENAAANLQDHQK